MRYLILADIHANIDALDAVLASAEARATDAVILLGDLVGYNAEPSAAIERLRSLSPAVMVRGNHDKVCAGLEPPTTFHAVARRAIEWTQRQLSNDDLAWLAALPQGPDIVSSGPRPFEVCHGAPFDEDFYVVDAIDARRALETTSATVCLNGHTHMPAVFRTQGFAVQHEHVESGGRVDWPTSGRVLVNVGSVGQPRDGNPRAAFGVLDAEAGTIHLHRVPYDVATAQRRIVRAGLPSSLAERLATGE